MGKAERIHAPATAEEAHTRLGSETQPYSPPPKTSTPIRVHDANTREWLSQRLQGKIALNLQSVTDRQITVKYVTAQEIPQ